MWKTLICVYIPNGLQGVGPFWWKWFSCGFYYNSDWCEDNPVLLHSKASKWNACFFLCFLFGMQQRAITLCSDTEREQSRRSRIFFFFLASFPFLVRLHKNASEYLSEWRGKGRLPCSSHFFQRGFKKEKRRIFSLLWFTGSSESRVHLWCFI